MFLEEVSRLEKELHRHRDDLEQWGHRLHRLRRFGWPPRFLDQPFHLPRLLRYWSQDPHDRSLLPMFLDLQGLERTDPGVAPPSFEWWQAVGRLGRAEDHWYDTWTGLPLSVTRPKDRSEMLLVPGGVSRCVARRRGMTLGRPPVCERYLPAFWMDRYPVTVRTYERFLQRSGWRVPHRWDDQYQYPDRPMAWVSSRDAGAFARWVDARLPLDVEWERASRGFDGRTYPWGEDLDDEGRHAHLATWYFPPRNLPEMLQQHLEMLDSVHARPEGQSPFGIQDMLGNVLEWCADVPTEHELRWMAPGARLDEVEPGEEYRIVRGGSVLARPLDLPQKERMISHRLRSCWFLGFRLVRPVLDLERLRLPAPEGRLRRWLRGALDALGRLASP